MASGDEIGIQKALSLLGGAFQNKVNQVIQSITLLKQPTFLGVAQFSLGLMGLGFVLAGVNLILMDFKLKKT
jgi:hypothetical protein